VSEAAQPALVIARFFTFGLAILLFGAASFAVYAPVEARPRPDVVTSCVGPLLLALAAVAYAGLLAREASGEPGWPPLALVADLYATTGFGRALATLMVGALGLAALGAFAARSRWWKLALSGLALASLAFVGHAADDAGARGAARLLLMALHLLAIGAWLGALPWLWRALGQSRADTPALLRRFGLIGGVSLAAVVASGLGTLWFVLLDARGSLGAGYTRTLVLKLAFVLGLFALAAFNRFRLTPLMSRDPAPARRALRRTIVLEQALGLGALASVAVLGQLDPRM
jgi:putative copper resistance protein D